MTFPANFTIDTGEGAIVGSVHLAEGRDGWGVDKIEIRLDSPVRPDFLAKFVEAWAQMLLSGGLEALIKAHDAERSEGDAG